MTDYRVIPSIDQLLLRPGASPLVARFGRDATVEALRAAAEGCAWRWPEAPRRRHRRTPPPHGWNVDASAWLAAAHRASLGRVLNATGVIIHTNLGRAPLAEPAIEAIARSAAATRTSSTTWRRAGAARATSTPNRSCAGSRAPKRRLSSTIAPQRRCWCWRRWRAAATCSSRAASSWRLAAASACLTSWRSRARGCAKSGRRTGLASTITRRDRRQTRRFPARAPVQLHHRGVHRAGVARRPRRARAAVQRAGRRGSRQRLA